MSLYSLFLVWWKSFEHIWKKCLHNPNSLYIYYATTDNPGLVGSDNESYGGKLIGGPPNRTSDSSIQSGTATPDIHPFFKVRLKNIYRYLFLYLFIHLYIILKALDHYYVLLVKSLIITKVFFILYLVIKMEILIDYILDTCYSVSTSLLELLDNIRVELWHKHVIFPKSLMKIWF